MILSRQWERRRGHRGSRLVWSGLSRWPTGPASGGGAAAGGGRRGAR